MITRARSTGRLRAGRITQQVLVAAGHPEPERVRHQLHDALETHLTDALTARFGDVAQSSDETVWRIRRLEIDLVVNTAWDECVFAGAWAAELAVAVTRAIASGADGVSIMRFASPAAYLASFVTDIANGNAWTRWWYGEFDGLRLLSRTATIRGALLRHVDTGFMALASLEPTGVEFVVSQLSRQDARRLVNAISDTLPDVDHASDGATILQITRGLTLPIARDAEAHWVLRVLAELYRSPMDRRTRDVVWQAHAVARLASLVAEGYGRLLMIVHALRIGDAAALRAVAGNDDSHILTPLVLLSPDVRRELVALVAQREVVDAATRHAATGDGESMPVAAPLLLAAAVAQLPFESVARDLPSIGSEHDLPARRASSAALLRLYTLAVSCGGERCARVLADPVTRRLAGVGADVSSGALATWIASRTDDDALRLEHEVGAWRLRDESVQAAAWLVVLQSESIPRSAVALIDCARGHWLAVRDAPRDAAIAALQPWLSGAVLGRVPEHMLCTSADALSALANCVTPATRLAHVDAGNENRHESEPCAQTLLRLDRLGDEIAWLTLPVTLRVPPAMACALQTAAQGVLRSLAWRLPGFARATLPHLWANFLSVDAQVITEPSRMVATISRPPLGMIVAMTGLLHQRYALPWMDPPMVALFPASGS